MPRPLASTRIPARIGDVHIDTVLAVRTGRSHDRTTVSTERGSPRTGHRQRVTQVLEVDILVSNSEPTFAAAVTGTWEINHADQTRERVFTLERLGSSIPFFDGRRTWRNPAGASAWVIDGIREQETPDEAGTWRATITLGEDAVFATTFTSIDEQIAASEQDAADGVIDKGQQSTETVPADLAATIPT